VAPSRHTGYLCLKGYTGHPTPILRTQPTVSWGCRWASDLAQELIISQLWSRTYPIRHRIVLFYSASLSSDVAVVTEVSLRNSKEASRRRVESTDEVEKVLHQSYRGIANAKNWKYG
jgi:hypothetical protein